MKWLKEGPNYLGYFLALFLAYWTANVVFADVRGLTGRFLLYTYTRLYYIRSKLNAGLSHSKCASRSFIFLHKYNEDLTF